MYTNIVNIPDSILFLTSCRLAIKESVIVNEEIDRNEKYGLVDFVMNEASDYQIMNIVVNDEYVEERYNALSELDLFDQYKEMMVENIDDFSAVVEAKDLKSLLYEIGPISQEGLSTATPVLEFLHGSGVLAEKGPTLIDVAKKHKDALLKKSADAKHDAELKMRGLKKSVPHKLKGKIKTGKEKLVAGKEKAITAKDALKQKASDVAFDTKVKMRGLKKSVPHRTMGALKTGGDKVRAAMGTKAGKAGAIALAAAAIYAGVKTYQRFMSQAAKSCGGQSGSAKTACMAKYKSNALRGQIAATQRGVGSCSNAKDPQKCKASIQSRVQKLQNKLSKVNA